jgi:hypothetical protein
MWWRGNPEHCAPPMAGVGDVDDNDTGLTLVGGTSASLFSNGDRLDRGHFLRPFPGLLEGVGNIRDDVEAFDDLAEDAVLC